MTKTKNKQYNINWRKMNKWIKEHKKLLFCENCCRNNITLHHIAPLNQRKINYSLADNPHFWMMLCPTCHWFASRYPEQLFQIVRLIEWEKKIFGFSIAEVISGGNKNIEKD